jgi:hypothetical protein
MGTADYNVIDNAVVSTWHQRRVAYVRFLVCPDLSVKTVIISVLNKTYCVMATCVNRKEMHTETGGHAKKMFVKSDK